MKFRIADLDGRESVVFADGPRLLADIGGTNARFALQYDKDRIGDAQVLKCADYAEFADAVAAYLRRFPHYAVRHACIAIANPVQGDLIKMTNHSWRFSIEAARRQLDLESLLVVNDFTALAMSLPALGSEDMFRVGGGARQQGVIGLVGAGTGLGVGGLVPAAGRWIALQSEGGHATFSPVSEFELDILRYCWRTYPHVSAERLVSGPGIEVLHQAICAVHGKPDGGRLSAQDIVHRALDGSDPVCVQTIESFCGMLGTVAGNVALTMGAVGGMYVGGGVVPRLGDYFASSPFRERFEAKGRFAAYLAEIPTFVVTAPYPALIGAAAILADHLATVA